MLSRYKILGKLGAGGMGVVYRAEDLTLKRPVALKIITGALHEDDHARARFLREARIAAALNHPNVCVIHDFGEVQPGEEEVLGGGARLEAGTPFISMELVEGRTLAALLRERHPLRFPELIDIAIQVASGLAAAHVKGVVHRDLKPSNVMLAPDGRVKILDFGLAKSVGVMPPVAQESASTASDARGLTTEGRIVGTVAYMSPEQAMSLRLDSRSDVFSFGTMLYEMATGKNPFEADTPVSMLGKILEAEPESLKKSSPASPAELEQIVRRCLRKHADDRYNDARDLVIALEGLRQKKGLRRSTVLRGSLWAAGVAGALLVALGVVDLAVRESHTSPIRIAILPFDNLGSPDDAYFASGMTEEITSRLANVRTLAVVSRTTATGHERKGKTLREIGRDLGVNYVVEGSVRWDRSGGGLGRVRITPQLVRVEDDTQLWSDSYDRQLADIFGIQSNVADGVIRALNLTLAPSESAAVNQVPTRNLDAYDLFLRAREMENQIPASYRRPFDRDLQDLDSRDPESRQFLDSAIEALRKAVSKDPLYALGWATLGQACWVRWNRFGHDPTYLMDAHDAVYRAWQLDPELPETLNAKGLMRLQDRYFTSAKACFVKATVAKPGLHGAWVNLARACRGLRDYQCSLRAIKQATDLQPENSEDHLQLGMIFEDFAEYDEAAKAFKKATELNPMLWNEVGAMYLFRGKQQEAIRAFERGIEIEPTRASILSNLGIARYQLKQYDKAAASFRRATEVEPNKAVHRGNLGDALKMSGKTEEARQAYLEAVRLARQDVERVPRDTKARLQLGYYCAKAGDVKCSLEEAENAGPVFVDPRAAKWHAIIRCLAGRPEEALDWLEKAVRLGLTRAEIELDPDLPSLGSQPRYRQIVSLAG